MTPRYYPLLALIILMSLVGCSAFPLNLEEATQQGGSPPLPTSISPAFPPVDITPTFIEPGKTSEATLPATSEFVRVWLPPDFDPDRNGAANEVLKVRLKQFEVMHPGMQLEVRVKALDGPGGMLDSLVATGTAAPDALPDLVLLPRSLLESAAVKGLLYPLAGLTGIMDDKVWFDYALQLAQLKGSTYGIPFAGDFMVLVHSTTDMENPPLSLGDTITQRKALIFPAGDTQSLYPLFIYLAEGGKIEDNQGRPILDESVLRNALDYFQQASLAEVMTSTLTQFIDDSQVWEALLGGEGEMAVTWASRFMKDNRVEQAGLALAPLPTPDGKPFTLANGWSLALAGQNPARREVAVQLAEFLVDKSFMADWSETSGYLPTRVDALQSWPASPVQQVIEQISYSAWLVPAEDIVSTVGPVLNNAVVDVLAGRSDADMAAQAAVKQITHP